MVILILKALRYRSWQTSGIIFLVSLAVAAIFAVTLLNQGMKNGSEQAKDRLGADLLVIPAGAQVAPGEIFYGGAPQNIYMPQSVAESIGQVPGIKRSTAQFFTQTLAEDCCDVGEVLRLVGIEGDSDWITASWRQEKGGRTLAADEVLLGSQVAAGQSKQFFLLGKMFRVAGVLAPSGTGIDRSIFLDMDTARKLASETPSLKPLFSGLAAKEDLVSAVLVELKPEASAKEVQAQLQAIPGVQVFSAVEGKKQMEQELTMLMRLFFFMSAMVIFAALSQLLTRAYEQVQSRRGEWGLYIALGLTPLRLAGLIVGESLLVCALGGAMGLILGFAGYQGIWAFIGNYQSFPFLPLAAENEVLWAFVIWGAMLVLGGLSALYPALRCSYLSAVDTFCQSDFE